MIYSVANHRLHDELTTSGPTAKAARDQDIWIGDIIMSRSNDITIDVKPREARQAGYERMAAGAATRGAGIDLDAGLEL